MRTLLIGAVLAWISGCTSGLGEAVDDLLAAAPEVCTRYCEDRNSCLWDGDAEDHEVRDRASSDDIHRCVPAPTGAMFGSGHDSVVIIPVRMANRTSPGTSWMPRRDISCARCVSTVFTLT